MAHDQTCGVPSRYIVENVALLCDVATCANELNFFLWPFCLWAKRRPSTLSIWSFLLPSSETQGRSVGPGEKALQKFLSTSGKAPGYRLSPDHFQTVKRMLVPDWAQKMLYIIVPNRRTASPEFFSWVRTRRLLTRSRLVWLMHRRNARSQESFSLI